MRAVLSTLVLCLCATASQAEVVFGDQAGCQLAAGQSPATDALFILHSDRIERMETVCDITGVVPEGAGRVRLMATCSGEGETWSNDHILDVSVTDGSYSIWQAEYPEYPSTLRQCSK
ncbi:hypothetical protein [Pontivivens insulae]|uniref:Cyanovirin-N domain-containing protein n=1 Tax=Pontivivens insulae TaxID=1639689 RepID=A0A2R8A6I1_9RHOB|nr:hypothetical protein [Pontivivens insulae]RED17955.1 hypothetical protein DFR53_0143 [Pontivivens insulae]SPF27844.1 hypothetical protein POI8812_00139 [Pontivivens insulae]